jgi:hypothetical protein
MPVLLLHEFDKVNVYKQPVHCLYTKLIPAQTANAVHHYRHSSLPMVQKNRAVTPVRQIARPVVKAHDPVSGGHV